jgi:hypothetical protein
MTIMLKPTRGGFLRPFGCGEFIRDFLLGLGPFGRPEIDSGKGACQEDIFYYYKSALHTAYAEDAVGRENDRRVRAGLGPYTADEYVERVDHILGRISYKLVKCRYHSFRRYFHWLKQLAWVEPTGEVERSSMQESTGDHPDAHPRILYRLTKKGMKAPDEAWSHPQRLVYPVIGNEDIDDYFQEKRGKRKYRRPRKYERFLRPFTVGVFILQYLMGLGPEDSPKIDPDRGEYTERIFFHYKEALRRAYARDAVASESSQRVQKKQDPYTPLEYGERLEWHLARIPYKLHRARSISFFRYFHYLKQLKFVELTGEEAESYIQSLDYIDAPPCRYYRLSAKGRSAPEHEWYRPQLTLYPEFNAQYFAQKNIDRRQRIKT